MIDNLAKDILNELKGKSENLKEFKESSEAQFKRILEAQFRKLDLVTREEFDAQQAILLRTREKLEALEAKFEEIESQINK